MKNLKKKYQIIFESEIFHMIKDIKIHERKNSAFFLNNMELIGEDFLEW